MKQLIFTILLFLNTISVYAGQERLTNQQPQQNSNPGLFALLPTADPGFEAGSPNPFWNESSTNFGSPICNANFCGLGTGTGPRSGDFWAWFGGINAFEESTLSQSINIPKSESATLTFFLEIPACDDDGFLEVLINSDQIFYVDQTDPNCGVVGYNKITLDISAYSDQTVNLTFHAIEQGVGSGAINFFVDDLSLDYFVMIPTLTWVGYFILFLMLVLITMINKNSMRLNRD